MFVAVILGILTWISTAYLDSKKTIANQKLERERAQGTLILEAIKAGGVGKEKDKQIAANLLFFADIKLIQLDDEHVRILPLKAEGALPSLPITGLPPLGGEKWTDLPIARGLFELTPQSRVRSFGDVAKLVRECATPPDLLKRVYSPGWQPRDAQQVQDEERQTRDAYHDSWH